MATNQQHIQRLSSAAWMASAPQMMPEISLTSPPMTGTNQPEAAAAVTGSQRKSTVTCNGNSTDVSSAEGGGCGGGGCGVVRRSKQCSACGQSIHDRYLLHTMDGFWHVRCLRCSCCQVALAEIGTSCFSRAGMTLCKADYLRLFGSTGTCSACGMTIPANEFVMKTQGNVYHVTCFACTTCHNRLVPGDRYGIINGSIICESDYCKLAKTQTISIRTNYKVCD